MKKKKLFSLVLATVLTAATVLPCYGASTKEKTEANSTTDVLHFDTQFFFVAPLRSL